jgi:hypothetical protein
MLKTCQNCGKEIITEADMFIYQNRPDGEYYSCGCVEFEKKVDVNDLKNWLRAVRVGDRVDPFVEYQMVRMAKGTLLGIIAIEVEGYINHLKKKQ